MSLITTIYGDMEETLLEKKTGSVDTAAEYTTWVEYRVLGKEEIVHRSVHMTLKEMPVFSLAEPGKY